MFKYKNRGYVIEIELPEKNGRNGYSVECRYYYDKIRGKYHVSLWLKRNDINDTFRIDIQYIDAGYINGTKDTIKQNICNLIEQIDNFGFFDYYIERYEYTCKCFDVGNEMFEKESSDN